MAGKTEILLIEDALPMARVYTEYLKGEPYTVTHVELGRAGLEQINTNCPNVILLDLHLPDMNGIEILKHVTDNGLPVEVVVITAHGSVTNAVEAMQFGAADFIVKPFTKDRLVYTVRNVLERQKLNTIVKTLVQDKREGYHGFIGSSAVMQAVYRTIDNAADSKATVFITGESGTGKEVCAEAIHEQSKRATKPFVPLNCAAIPAELMESEIFGHVKGAFTGAVAERIGAAGQADGGTLFLDEICEMDLSLQAKLLRFIQTGAFQKVGGSQLEPVDVRFICATNRDPWAEVQAGRFREDLYYRLHVIPLHLPPLTERDDDIIEIAEHFLSSFAGEEGKDFNGFSEEAEAEIRAYPWPGNVRELQNVVRNAVVMNRAEQMDADMIRAAIDSTQGSGRGKHRVPTHVPNAAVATPAPAPAAVNSTAAAVAAPHNGELVLRPLKEVEWDYIQAALKVTKGNVPRAAALLEISPSTIYRRLKEMGETATG